MKKQNCVILFATIGLAILILDTKTAITGMTEGIAICLQTLIPSLFPFMVLSSLLTSSLLGKYNSVLSPLGRVLRMPPGTESIFLVGLLGGYPVGAQCIAQAVNNGRISRENGQRMLAFCSNAGPAFLFGLGNRLFPAQWYCWVIWIIHIVSAVTVGFLTPAVQNDRNTLAISKGISFTDTLFSAIKTMALVCGWVLLFKVILVFCQRWFLWMLPQGLQVVFSGFLELANGCCTLAQVPQMQARMVLFSVFLAFGGLCVGMQTRSVCNGLAISGYFLGKLLQTVFSFLITVAVISREMRFISLGAFSVIGLAYYFVSGKLQKMVAFFHNPVYNKENKKRGTYHAVSQKNGTTLRILRPRYCAE